MSDKDSVWMESYRQQRIQEAEHQRLVDEVLAANTKAAILSSYQRAILWLANGLILWGVSLNNRYGQIPILRLDTKLRKAHQ